MRWLIRRLEACVVYEAGATTVEYALILLLVALTAVTTLPGVGTALTPIFTQLISALTIP